MKRLLSISHLILPLLALATAHSLSAQTLVVDKTNLTFSAQIGGSAGPQTINVTSSTGTPINFTLSYPNSPWLKVNGQPLGVGATTPFQATVTADATGLSAGTLTANIIVTGGASGNNPPIAVTFTVSAIGVNTTSLAFTYTFGSGAINLPSAQSITVSGASAYNTSFTSAANWFFLNQNCSPCSAPSSVTAVISNQIVLGLPPATYTGSITITPVPAGQGPATVVQLTLTVLPTPPVTVDPASLIFNWQTGIAAPNPTQTFTISTTPTQTLSYSFSAPTVDAGLNWIVVTPPDFTFTGSVQIPVIVTPAGLSLGTHTGKFTLFTPGASPTQQDISVTLNVSNTLLLNVPNATLSFSSQSNASDPPAQFVNVTATSGTPLYSVSPSANSPWLIVATAGIAGTPLQVSVHTAGLAPGTYRATLNIALSTGGASQSVTVVLKVSDDPAVSASVGKLSFPYQIGQSFPAAQSVKITSSSGVPLNYTASLATTTCGSTWLLAANANNSLTGVTDDPLTGAITVSVNVAGLTAATCNGTLTINATNPATGAAALNSPLSIPVTLFVSTTAQLVLTPANLQPFTVGVGVPSPAAQSITLTSTNSDVLAYNVAFVPNNGGNWLSVNTVGATTTANNVLVISVNAAGLAPGAYTATVTITATGPGGAAVADSPVVIPVTLNVSAGSLTLGATDISFPDQTLGGPAPPVQTVTIGSIGQALNYSAVANSNNAVTWLAVSPARGNTSVNGILTVIVDGSRLPAGSYTGTIQVTALDAGNSHVTLTVHFRVNPGTLSAPNTTLTFTQAAGGPAPAAQSIAVSGSPAPLNYTVVAAMLNGANWLTATPASGATPSSVQVSVNGAALPVGQYIGSVTVASAGANGSPIAVPVVLNVVTPAVLAASPTTLAFAYTVGLAAPAAQNLTVTSTGGTGAVPLTAQVQLDGTATGWLSVTPTSSNNTPATLAVSVLPTILAPGTYTGRIVVTSPNALVATTIPVTLTVTAIAKPVVGSVGNAASYSTGGVSPGENIVIFGTGVGPATLTKAVAANNVFPTLVGTTRVLFDNIAAPIIYASSGQTSAMVPYGVAGRTTTSVVVEFSGVQSAPITYNVVLTAPGIYTLNAQGSGPGAVLNQDGLTVNSLNAPEKRGNVIAIYMTGEGQTNPQGADGVIIPAVVSALKLPQQTVTVTIGGVDAVVAYAGSAPGLISGVMQVNAIIPLTAPTGTQPVVVTVGGVKSQSGASAATVVVQ